MSQTEVVESIARALAESAEEPMRLIREIVDAVGEKDAMALLEEAQRVEAAGGMTVARGTRRRSPGGVYFKLAKERLPHEARKRIFRAPRPPKPEGEVAAEPVKTPKPVKKEGAPEAPRAMPEVVVRSRRRIISAVDELSPAPQRVETSVGFGARVERAASSGAPPPAPPEPPRPVVRERVLVRVASAADVPAKSLQEAIDRGGKLFSELEPRAARAALLELIDRFGGLPEPEPEPLEEESPVDLEALRTETLVSIAQGLGLGPAELARVLFGNDTPALRRKAKALIEGR